MHDATAALDIERWIRFVNCWQRLLQSADDEGASLASMRRLVDEFVQPDMPVPPFLLRTIISGGLLSYIRACPVDARASLTPLLMDFVSRQTSANALRVECLTLLEQCEDVTSDAAGRLHTNQTLIRVLTLIEASHRDPHLTLQQVSEAAQLSVSYISRLLNRHLGCGFRTHLHRLRVASAQQLLKDHSLSVKQVAFDVGYRSTSEFDRHFRRLCATTPAAFRRTVVIPLQSQIDHRRGAVILLPTAGQVLNTDRNF
jgi:AraC-like DNA-binding protein